MKEILKNNILSVICGVIVIIALVVPIWPMGGYKEELKTRLNERVGTYNSLVQIKNKPRALPNVDADPNAQPVPLEGFPNENVITKGDEVKAAFETQAKQLVDKAIAMNAHAPLVPGALPTPANNAVAIAFRDRYRALILPPMAGPAVGGVNPQGLSANMLGGIAQHVKAGVPPTQQDITNAQQDLWRRQYAPQLGNAPGGGNANARQALQNEYNDAAARIPDIERNRVANSIQFYMNPDAIPYIPVFNNPTPPDPLNIWNAQLNLWVIDDVMAGIADANAGAKNVTQGPVKQLVKLTLPYPQPYIIMAGQTMEGDLTGPAPKVLDLAAQGQTSPIPMTTGRVCNPLYDVIQFDLVLNVDAASVPRVMEAFSHNRFVTVLTSSLSGVDLFAMKQQGYMFGDKPVVQLTLRMEDVFFHKWERPLMPKPMSDLMAGVQPVTGGGAEGGPGGVNY